MGMVVYLHQRGTACGRLVIHVGLACEQQLNAVHTFSEEISRWIKKWQGEAAQSAREGRIYLSKSLEMQACLNFVCISSSIMLLWWSKFLEDIIIFFGCFALGSLMVLWSFWNGRLGAIWFPVQHNANENITFRKTQQQGRNTLGKRRKPQNSNEMR